MIEEVVLESGGHVQQRQAEQNVEEDLVNFFELIFAQGAAGVVPKTHSALLLQKAIEIVMEGGIYLPPALALRLARTGPAMPAPRAVSRQQSRILELLAQGLPNKAIARQLGIACSTVRNQLTLAFKRLSGEPEMLRAMRCA